MALFLLHRTAESDRRASGQHAALVDASSESEARTLAGAPDSWAAVQLAATATMPQPRHDGNNDPLRVIKFDGDAVSLGNQTDRGGNHVGRDQKII